MNIISYARKNWFIVLLAIFVLMIAVGPLAITSGYDSKTETWNNMEFLIENNNYKVEGSGVNCYCSEWFCASNYIQNPNGIGRLGITNSISTWRTGGCSEPTESPPLVTNPTTATITNYDFRDLKSADIEVTHQHTIYVEENTFGDNEFKAKFYVGLTDGVTVSYATIYEDSITGADDQKNRNEFYNMVLTKVSGNWKVEWNSGTATINTAPLDDSKEWNLIFKMQTERKGLSQGVSSLNFEDEEGVFTLDDSTNGDGDGGTGGTTAVCGNDQCEAGENFDDCPEDCPAGASGDMEGAFRSPSSLADYLSFQLKENPALIFIAIFIFLLIVFRRRIV